MLVVWPLAPLPLPLYCRRARWPLASGCSVDVRGISCTDIIKSMRLMYGCSVEIVVEQLIDASANDGTSKHFASLSACVRSCVPRACVRAAEGGGRPREWPPSTGSHCPSASRGQSARGPHWEKGDIMPPFHQGPLPIQVPESPRIPQRDKGTLDS